MRRSTVLILPLQLAFPAQKITTHPKNWHAHIHIYTTPPQQFSAIDEMTVDELSFDEMTWCQPP